MILLFFKKRKSWQILRHFYVVKNAVILYPKTKFCANEKNFEYHPRRDRKLILIEPSIGVEPDHPITNQRTLQPRTLCPARTSCHPAKNQPVSCQL